MPVVDSDAAEDSAATQTHADSHAEGAAGNFGQCQMPNQNHPNHIPQANWPPPDVHEHAVHHTAALAPVKLHSDPPWACPLGRWFCTCSCARNP